MAPSTNLSARAARATLAAALLLGFLGATARAQWTVVDLHPAGASMSRATAVEGAQQVGYALFGNDDHASVWAGSAASWVDLMPAGAFDSRVFAVDGGGLGGWVDAGMSTGDPHASLWSNAAAAWIDLNPVWPTAYPMTFMQSYVLGMSATQQVGAVYPLGGTGDWRASLWSGSESTWVSLHPTLSSWSYAYDVDAGQQVGWVRNGNVNQASLWTGSSASWVSLHPAGATASQAFGVCAGQQVGHAVFPGSVYHAGLWNSTAASWVDLHPAGADGSQAFAVHAGQQVGYARFGGVYGAALWSGTAGSWVDLHACVPANFDETRALGIWHDATATYVVGYGRNTAISPNREEALLWTLPYSVTTYCTAGTTTNGCVPSLAHAGTPSASAGAGFTITASGVEGQQSGLIFYGVGGGLAAPWGLGSSFMCVKAPLERAPTANSGGTAGLCDGVLALDWNLYIATHAGALGTPFLGGESVWAQAWFRDPPAPRTTNLSNALQFSVTP